MKSHAYFALAVTSLLALTLSLAACGGGSSRPASTAFAYLASPQSQSVFVLSVPTDKMIATIPIGSGTPGSAPQAVAFSPDGPIGYVTDANTAVWVINPQLNSVMSLIPVANPYQISMSPSGARAYVTTYTGVSVIDTSTFSISANIVLGNSTSGIAPSAVAVAPIPVASM